MILIDGYTADGTHVVVEESEPMKFTINVGGYRVEQTEEPIRYRDGGTTIIKTTAGKIYYPSPFYKDRVPTFNEQRIT